MEDCVFCKIVNKEIPSHKVWEDENYLAFLDIRPMAKGMTLVMPKEHTGSNFWELDNSVISDALDASRKVAKILDEKLEDNMRTTLLLEGTEVDHLHFKLIPLYQEDLKLRKTLNMPSSELSDLAEYLSS